MILAASFAIAYIWIIGLVIMGYTSPWLFLVFLSVPKPVQAVKGFVKNEMPMNMIIAMKSTAQTNTFFGFLLSIGLLISYFR